MPATSPPCATSRRLTAGRYRFVHANICDLAALDMALPGHDAVVHFAAESHVDRSIAGPEGLRDDQLRRHQPGHARRRRPGVERVVHISTDEVYGSVEDGCYCRGRPARAAFSVFVPPKAGSDLIALSYYTTYGFPVMVTRSSNNFGPWQYPEKVIPLFVTNLLDGKNVPLYGDGLNQRDWLFVEDNCAAVDRCCVPGHRARSTTSEPVTSSRTGMLTDKFLALAGAGPETGQLRHGPVGPRPPLRDQF